MRRLGALVLLLTLTACSGGGSDDTDPAGDSASTAGEAPSPDASTTSLQVILTDVDEPSALFPLDDEICTTTNPLEKLENGEKPTPLEISLVNEDGDVVGMQTLPETGGTFDPESGCTWEISFTDLPPGEAFEVQLVAFTAGAGTTAAPGQVVELSF